jgi:hypothetical protein
MSRITINTFAFPLSLIGGLAFTIAFPLIAQQQAMPDDYADPAALVTARGLAPKIKGQELGTLASRTFIVTFGEGDDLISGLTEFAEKNRITSGHFSGVGGVTTATLGWGDATKTALMN